MAGPVWRSIDDSSNEYLLTTPLTLAVRRGREDVVKLLTQSYKVDVNRKLNHEHTMVPLLQATFDGHEGIVRALLQRPDLDVNAYDVHGRNALSLAASEGHVVILQILLEHGGMDISLRDKLGRSIFARAARNGHQRVVDILQREVADVANCLNETDRHAILDTLCRGNANVLRTILESNPNMDCNKRDSWGTTILSKAAYRGFDEVVQVLLSHSDDQFSEPDNFEFTALDWARYRGNKDVANILRSHSPPTTITETRIDEELSDPTLSADEGHGRPLRTSDVKCHPVDARTMPSLDFKVGETPEELPGEIWCVAFSRDGRRLATGHGDGNISTWQSDTATLIWTQRDSVAGVAHVSWSPDDSFLLSCGRDGKARLWDPDVSLFSPCCLISFWPRPYLIGKQGQAFFLLHLLTPLSQEGSLMRTTPRLQEPYSSSAWDPNGNILFLGSFDSYYSIQQLRTDNWPACISTWRTGTTYRTEALALSPEGQKLVRMTDEDVIEVFDVSTKTLTTTISMHSRPLSIEISWDSKNILVNSQAGHLHVLDIGTGAIIDSYKGPTMRAEFIIRAVFGAPQDEFVLSAAEGATSLPTSFPSKRAAE